MPGHVMNTYGRIPVTFARGQGVWLEAVDGERYLDALSGIAVCALGHAHPEIVETLCQQASRLIHTSNINPIPQQEALADKLAAVSGLDQAFFANSGAEANEAALKLSRLHARERGIDRPQVVVFDSAFHGRTLATLSASDSAKVQQGFEPLVEGFIRLPYGDIDALQALAAERGDIVAVLMEPIQGEGGVRPPPAGFLTAVRALCDERDWLLMLDEIQTGVGRTGQWYACQHEQVLPDVLTTAKGLGAGVPVAACLATERVAGYFKPGKHGSTFGGNPLACAVALKTLEVLEAQNLLQQVRERGAQLQALLEEKLGPDPRVVDIRGQGLMVGVECDRPVNALVGLALEEKLIINVTRDSVIRLVPPLIISAEEVEMLVDRLQAALAKLAA